MVLTPVTLTTPSSVLGVIMRQPSDIIRMIGWIDAIKSHAGNHFDLSFVFFSVIC